MSIMKPASKRIGIGPDEELGLRISVAAIVGVYFSDPENGKTMLVLERTATLQMIDGKPEVSVKVKPFGGGVRLLDPERLNILIGKFHYDSRKSSEEKDFRIRANPDSWVKIKEICKEHLIYPDKGLLDTGPERELGEEFEDSLKIKIGTDDYFLRKKGMVFEDLQVNTNNINAPGSPTVRVYYLFDARIKSQHIIKQILENSRKYSDNDLSKMALEDYNQGGKGRVNAVLSVEPDDLKNFYVSIPVDKRGGLLRYGEHQLEGNIPALFEDISSNKFKRFTI